MSQAPPFGLGQRLPGRRVPHTPIAALAPDLAVEVISPGNTAEEMRRKLADYFAASVQCVWYVYPERRQVVVYAAPDQSATFGPGQTLDGGRWLPGFTLDVDRLFAEPPAA